MKNSNFAKIITLFALSAILLSTLASCGGVAYEGSYSSDYYSAEKEDVYGNEDPSIPVEIRLEENREIKTADNAVSTFSADVDTASYTLFRSLVQNGISYTDLLENYAGWFRTEEFINYFDYSSYKEAADGELFGVNSTVVKCPWNEERYLLVLGLAADSTIPETVSAGNNYVFLVDVSGSMASVNKLPLLQKALNKLTESLGDDDIISIVTYAGKERVVLEGCSGAEKDKILKAVDDLRASGSTNGQSGMQKAYEIAEKYFIENGNNRIIMASDGDLNVGISSVDGIKQLVSEKKETGVYLSVLGFGSGNYRDSIMESIADNGNGAYYYIDGESEAEKVFGTDFASTMFTVGTDVKLQLTFNTENVISYRQIGYENRQLSEQDFTDDSKDAGEVGAGHRLTVIYELELAPELNADSDSELCKLAIRYKKPTEDESTLQEAAVTAAVISDEMTDDSLLAVSIAETCLLLRGSEYIKTKLNLLDVITTLSDITSDNTDVSEFKDLIRTLINSQMAQ